MRAGQRRLYANDAAEGLAEKAPAPEAMASSRPTWNWSLLDKGKIEKMDPRLGSIASTNPEIIEKLRIEAAYLERNGERMHHPKFRRRHL